MRSTVIPAQITTVEDKIAGNLNAVQVLLLMSPIFFGIGMYLVFPPFMNFSWYKIAAICVVSVICTVPALRIKDKLVLDWLIVYMHFILRPAYYVFNKNNSFGRDIYSLNLNLDKNKIVKETHKSTTAPIKTTLSVGDEARFEQLFTADKLSLKIMPLKKGGVHVAVEKIR